MLKLRSWVGTGAALGALMLCATPSYAQKPKAPTTTKPKDDPGKPNLAEAKKHYTDGETKFKAGEYAGALEEFKAADAIKATPQAARYIGLSADKLGRFPDAVAAYERFLADVPAKLKDEAETIKKRVDEIKAMPGKVKVATTPAGATLTVDGTPNPQPSPTELSLPPGKHTIALKAEGREAAERSVDVTYASTQDLNVELKELPPPPAPVVAPPPPVAKVEAPPEPPPEPRSLVPAFITGGLAVGAAGVGAVFGVMALKDKSDYDKNPTADKADDGENHALIADMAFGVAITMGVTSIVLFATRDEPAAPKAASVVKPKVIQSPKFSATPIVTKNGGGAGAVLRF